VKSQLYKGVAVVVVDDQVHQAHLGLEVHLVALVMQDFQVHPGREENQVPLDLPAQQAGAEKLDHQVQEDYQAVLEDQDTRVLEE